MREIKVADLKVIFNKVIAKLEFEKGKDSLVTTNTSIYRIIPIRLWDKYEKPTDWFSASEIDQ